MIDKLIVNNNNNNNYNFNNNDFDIRQKCPVSDSRQESRRVKVAAIFLFYENDGVVEFTNYNILKCQMNL